MFYRLHPKDEGTVFTGVCPYGRYPMVSGPRSFLRRELPPVLAGGVPQYCHWSCPKSCLGEGYPNLGLEYPPPGQEEPPLPHRTRVVVQRGRYASCIYAGGLSCQYLFCSVISYWFFYMITSRTPTLGLDFYIYKWSLCCNHLYPIYLPYL